MSAAVIQLKQGGSLKIPDELQRRYNLSEGDVFTLVDLGDGAFLLTPQESRVDALGDKVTLLATENDVDLDELLITLDEERQRYYREHYVQPEQA